MHYFYRNSNFISPSQLEFIPTDATVNQLMVLYHSICRALDEGNEIRAVFRNISQALNRDWHECLLFKLRQSVIGGILLAWLLDYLCDMKQRVVLFSAASDIVSILSRVPQGSILGPLLLCVYINDIVTFTFLYASLLTAPLFILKLMIPNAQRTLSMLILLKFNPRLIAG